MPLSPPPRDADGKVIPHDHPGIGSADGIIRRITEQYIVQEADGRRRLSTMAFGPSNGPNEGMSVDLQAQIVEAGLDCREHLDTTTPQCVGAIRFEAGALRKVNLQIGFDPLKSNPHHGEVWGRFTGKMKGRILPNIAAWFVEIAGVSIDPRQL